MNEKTETVTANELAGIALAAPPPAAAAAPAPAAAPGLAPVVIPKVETDVFNRPFDPRKFRPQKDRLGRWKNLRQGPLPGWRQRRQAGIPEPERAPEPAPSFVAPDPVPEPLPAVPPAPAGPIGPDKYDLSADVYTRAFYASADTLFSGRGEWAPDNDDEHIQLRNAVAAYMRAKGLDDLPPGAALALALGTFCAKRIQRPNTNTRWRLLVAYWKARIDAWRSSRKIRNLPAVE